MTRKDQALWQQMADLTLDKCLQSCKNLGSCCSSEYCDMAADMMEKAGLSIPPRPFIVNGKCVVPPHFRPLCALHQCKISSFGYDLKDRKWTEKYFALREKLS